MGMRWMTNPAPLILAFNYLANQLFNDLTDITVVAFVRHAGIAHLHHSTLHIFRKGEVNPAGYRTKRKHSLRHI
jgi:hypothetical protein